MTVACEGNGMSIGVVVFVSRNGGMIVVQHDRGFSVVELLGGEGEIGRGDRLRADWLALGGEPFEKDGDSYDAYFQGCWGNPNAAVDIARRIGGG